MSSLIKKVSLSVALLSSLCFSYANAAEISGNSIVVKSCIDNQNFDEQGLIHCYQQAEATAKDQVYNLSGQGEHYKNAIDTQCQKLQVKLNADASMIKSVKEAQIAVCYANGWSRARDEVLNEKY
ncbi:hypothetical protein [Photobacterium angustum]|uniref:hypothetical protein n=1 Tax=Photobacterium angustum TaxID=661 RepID=UPI0005E727D5|nr:hypothetical protein [Photobacterium angustum]KJG02228.1 hypothetical protein UB35_08855 [Photobacterium angustum]KJG17491.1 hypothetical protein UA33_09380 [Photobacterium angustum]KJG23963.1 hypothetical protein UA39_09935 [Photobacterium angustum]KJG31351.1 hypothetical protein UA36_09595 [Photobacterium angustum]PSV66979.1 hypothetical protein CTM95_10075 [Photobacterium angustum]